MSDELKIEYDIPIPKRRKSWGVYSTIVRSLNIGDSVLLPIRMGNATSIGVRCCGKGCYTTRTEGKGTRLWRTK